MSVTVELTSDMLSRAKAVGERRHAVHVNAGRRDGKVLADGGLIHVRGATAELAVAVVFGIPWDGEFFENQAWLKWRGSGRDVGPFEVRSTTHGHGRLLLHPADNDGSPFILVRSHSAPIFHIAGWAYGREGKNESYWKTVGGYNRPAFYLPNDKLRPINEELRGLVLTHCGLDAGNEHPCSKCGVKRGKGAVVHSCSNCGKYFCWRCWWPHEPECYKSRRSKDGTAKVGAGAE